MSPRKPRNLSPEEKKLWSRVAENTTPLSAVRPKQVDPASLFKPKLKPSGHARPIPQFALGEKRKPKTSIHSLAPAIADQVAGEPIQMDRKSFTRMKRGKLSPDATLDLHGMTIAQAHPALISFVLNANANGYRLILVITGKGKFRDEEGPIPVRIGALRHQVPQWLKQAPLGPIVLQVAQANQKHGGSGAYYVYLRRQR